MFHSTFKRIKARWSLQALIDRPWVSEAAAFGLLTASTLPIPRHRRLALRTAGARRCETPASRALAHTLIAPSLRDENKRHAWRENKVGWGRYFGGIADIDQDKALSTSLVLKAPGPNGEKGVLYSSFEFNWMRILANHDARAFFKDYLLVGASSWSPGDHSVMASLQGVSEDPIFLGISNESDMAHYRLWEPGIRPVPLNAGDWINPNFYDPKPHSERTIDIVMVSHFAKWKRHWLLFEALSKMDPMLRVALIGRNADTRNEQYLREEAAAFGVKQYLQFYRNLEIDEVTALQCNAKAAVALSRREGSCVAVTEAMFADTPVVMMEDAHVGTRSYINRQTGRIARRSNLASVLTEVVRHSHQFRPRQWALENISASQSSGKLNAILRDYCVEKGLPWTRDIVPMCWRYVPSYLNPEDEAAMQPAVEQLRAVHGITLSRFAGERASYNQKQAQLTPTPHPQAG
jgi:glycosyltransferase involved in cell wall biosynthesis